MAEGIVGRGPEPGASRRLVMPHRPSGALERVRRTPLADRILERLPGLEVTIVAGGRDTTDAYPVGRGD